ncbi:MAG: hypothetical protein VBE63_22110 [Lamprobacter sp.]|nr:hypothetical protein [Lamprobacter sp.]MEA3642612.1 hypothetical protein [Lamprobacter sp.]
MFVGKSMRILQMSQVLDQREASGGGTINPDPARIAKIVANFPGRSG